MDNDEDMYNQPTAESIAASKQLDYTTKIRFKNGNGSRLNSYRSGSNGSMSKRSLHNGTYAGTMAFNTLNGNALTSRNTKNGIGMMNPIDTFEAKSKSISYK